MPVRTANAISGIGEIAHGCWGLRVKAGEKGDHKRGTLVAIYPFLTGVFNKIYSGDLKRGIRRIIPKYSISSRLRSVIVPRLQQTRGGLGGTAST